MRGMSRARSRGWVLGVGAALALVLASCGGDDGVGLDAEALDLEAVNDSGYSGEVIVTSPGRGQSQLLIALGREDEPEAEFPVAIQEGNCEGLSGRVVQDLGQLQSGLLTMQIPVTLESLRAADHALVVFQSNERQVYVACADF